MRTIEITKYEFDNFLFLAWANAQNPGDPEIVVRITRKLKAVSLELPLNERQEALRSAGKIVYPDRTLMEDQATISLEEDEWAVVRDMFLRSLCGFTTLAMEEAYGLWERIKGAQKAPLAEEASHGRGS